MEIAYQLTEDDYRQGYKAFRKRTKRSLWLKRLSDGVFLLVLAATVLILVVGPDRSFSTLAPLLFFLAFWIYCIWYGPRYVARKMIRGSPSAYLPHATDISETELKFRTSASDARLGWELIIGWAEVDRVFALFPSPVSFLPIPKRAMTQEQQNELRALLQTKFSALK